MPTLRERLTPEIIAQLENRTISLKAASATLGVHWSYLSTVFNQVSIKKRGAVVQQREANSALVASRRHMRISLARKVVAGQKTLEQAAKIGKCSERTIRRYADKIRPETL